MEDIYLGMGETLKTIREITKTYGQKNIAAPESDEIAELLDFANHHPDTKESRTIHDAIRPFLPYAEKDVLNNVSLLIGDFPPDLQLPYIRSAMRSDKFDAAMLENMIEYSAGYFPSLKQFVRNRVVEKGSELGLDLRELTNRLDQKSKSIGNPPVCAT